MTFGKLIVGAYGERLAARYLIGRGLTVLERNWRCPGGELDLVLRDGADLVFCEVKTRRGPGFGEPVEAVGREKVRRLRRLAGRWLAAGRPRRTGAVRFDVVGVLGRGRATQIEHLRRAF
jgi:putative endonuclease